VRRWPDAACPFLDPTERLISCGHRAPRIKFRQSLSLALLRPPPSLRIRPGANVAGSFSSAMPWRISAREIPMAFATIEIPPRQILRAPSG
jgi:hypothetical protein